MVTIFGDELRGADFVDADLTGATFRETRLAGVRMRGVELAGAEIDGEIDGLTIWGVEVVPLLLAELRRRHPVFALLDARTAEGLRRAWAALEAMWAPTMARAEALPPGLTDRSVDGEWSFAQTLRHLVLATDGWLNEGIANQPRPFHPLGMPFRQLLDRAAELGLDPAATPPYAEVVRARAERVAMVRDFLATVTDDRLAERVDGPVWSGDHRPTVLESLQVILSEEWNHHRYAVRDLDAVEAGQHA